MYNADRAENQNLVSALSITINKILCQFFEFTQNLKRSPEKNLHTTPNSQRLIDNLAIDNPLMYAALTLDCELQAWADAMDEDWSS